MRLHRLGIPAESRQAFTQLVEAGLLDQELGKHLGTMVGFRNIAVHNYRELDIEVVRKILKERLVDLQAFARLLVALGLPSSQ